MLKCVSITWLTFSGKFSHCFVRLNLNGMSIWFEKFTSLMKMDFLFQNKQSTQKNLYNFQIHRNPLTTYDPKTRNEWTLKKLIDGLRFGFMCESVEIESKLALNRVTHSNYYLNWLLTLSMDTIKKALKFRLGLRCKMSTPFPNCVSISFIDKFNFVGTDNYCIIII